MKKFAVSYITFFDNMLLTKIVEANNWKEALDKSEFMLGYELPDIYEDAQSEAFNCDSMFNVTEIK